MEKILTSVWIFNGEDGRFSSGVFTNRSLAEGWIKHNRLTGILTLYPINVGIYDWAIKNNLFTPSKEKESTPNLSGDSQLQVKNIIIILTAS